MRLTKELIKSSTMDLENAIWNTMANGCTEFEAIPNIRVKITPKSGYTVELRVHISQTHSDYYMFPAFLEHLHIDVRKSKALHSDHIYSTADHFVNRYLTKGIWREDF